MDGPTFVIERFGWGAPDRLEVSGTFSGLVTETSPGAVLTVVGDDGPHRLPAIDQVHAEAPTDGARWAAAFSWREAPVAFDRARLELGTSLAVDLPAPGRENGGHRLAVEVLEEAGEAEPPAAEEPPEPPAPPAAADPAARLRLETQLLDQAEQLEEARAAARQAEAALLRAESDLAAEREARAADAARFREGLTLVRSSAEEAIEQSRSELDALRGALAAAQADAQALVDRLSGRR